MGINGAETEWIKTFTDLAGQSVKTEYADGAIATMDYNAPARAQASSPRLAVPFTP